MNPVDICGATTHRLTKPLISALAPSQHGMVDRATLVIYVILFLTFVIIVNAQNCQFEFGVQIKMNIIFYSDGQSVSCKASLAALRL